MNSPGIPVGDGVGASSVVSDTSVGSIVAVDGSGTVINSISEIHVHLKSASMLLPYE